MKHRILLLLALLLGVWGSSPAKGRRVCVKTPGTLPALIGEKKKLTLDQLTVEGALNGTDLLFLREMAGSNYYQLPTAGRLRRLDLSRATFARGGEAYVMKDRPQYVEGGPRTLPPFLFRQCKLEEIVLPERMDTIGVGAFERSALRRVQLPEAVVIDGWAFNHCEQLAEVRFPHHLVELKQNVFRDCPALRRLEINDVQYINFNAFVQVPNLEEVVVNGTLWHVDGWVCHDCPNLRRIEFGGVVLTAGGPPIASSCPKLSEIVFSGAAFSLYFGSVEDCPLVERCRVTGYLQTSQDAAFVPQQFNLSAVPAAKVENMLRGVREFFDAGYPHYEFYNQIYVDKANVAYNMACLAALNGYSSDALYFLNKAAENGYHDYDHALADTDLKAIRGEERFGEVMEKVKRNHAVWLKEHDYLHVLRTAPHYAHAPRAGLPAFSYDPPTDTDLRRVRDYFPLDSIAGQGDLTSQMVNIMDWLHDRIRHDGASGYPKDAARNAIDLYEACRAQQRGINCRGLAFMLAEMYLAMGWPARALGCVPKDFAHDNDSHVITVVWHRDLQKWVWMDPTFSAYVTDENGLLLHPGEVRQRLIDGRPLVLNEEANWNHESMQTKEHYLEEYMAKNLYYMGSYLHQSFGVEMRPYDEAGHWWLAPGGMSVTSSSTDDEAWFWQAPPLQ